eukprot:373407_1
MAREAEHEVFTKNKALVKEKIDRSLFERTVNELLQERRVAIIRLTKTVNSLKKENVRLKEEAGWRVLPQKSPKTKAAHTLPTRLSKELLDMVAEKESEDALYDEFMRDRKLQEMCVMKQRDIDDIGEISNNDIVDGILRTIMNDKSSGLEARPNLPKRLSADLMNAVHHRELEHNPRLPHLL